MDEFNVYFSNRLTILYERLKASLFSKGSNPFKKRIVVVYGPAMKAWLTLRMAQDPELEVASGIEFIYLNQAFDQLSQLFQTSLITIPSQLELSLAIEKELYRFLTSFPDLDHAGQRDWLPLFHYLKIKPEPPFCFSRKMEKRIASLSLHLADLFQEYGRFAEPLTNEWEINTSGGWQGKIWNSLFGSKTEWTFPTKAFKFPMNSMENAEVHFFSISFISRSEFDFICRLSVFSQVSYYLISPCAVFWSDIRSDKEASYLRNFWQKKLGEGSSQLLQLEELLRDRNPLLANFGRLGREMACQIEESMALIHACYLLPSHVQDLGDELLLNEDLQYFETEEPLTLLHAIQADILMMRNCLGQPPVDLKNGESIQLHNAPTKRREVQILMQNLLQLMQKDPSLSPSDMIVMTPQITDYASYVQSIFGHQESPIDFQILDLGMQAQNESVQGFLYLISLSEGRWEAGQLLQLFEDRSFQRCHPFTQKDCQLIRKWIRQAGIIWGEDPFHRNELLLKDHCQRGMCDETAVGTWSYGLDRILAGLIKLHQEESFEMLPCDGVDFSNSDLLGNWIRLLHNLKDDLSPLQDRTQMTMEEWSCYLNCLLESYFKPDYDRPKSIEEYDSLKAQLTLLGTSSRSFKDAKFNFQSVNMHLNQLLQKKEITYRENHLQSVRFCSLMPLRSIPARVIVLLGMQEGAFPRLPVQSSLNQMAGLKNADYCPTLTDYDRYLFLEALHSAQDYFIVSYQGFSSEEAKELQPCLAIAELFSYLEKNYTMQGKKISETSLFKHPFDPFDRIYFDRSPAPFASSSLFDFKCARSHYSCEKSSPHSFFGSFPPMPVCPGPIVLNRIIDLKDLRSAASNPIKFFLNKGQEIYLEGFEERKLKNVEELSLSFLDLYQLKKDALGLPIQKVLNSADQRGCLPNGLFKQAAMNRFQMEMKSWHANLRSLNIQTEQIFSIELSASCSAPVQMNDRWILPPLTFQCTAGEKISIIGKLPYVTSHGLLILSKGAFGDIWKAWPEFLLFNYAATFLPQPLGRQLISVQGGKPKKAFFNDPLPYLKDFVHYYTFCFRHLSPLHPDWIPFILREDVKGLENKMKGLFQDSFGGYQSPELGWVLNRSDLPNAEIIFENWKEQAKILAGPIEEWEKNEKF
ncbi:MAG: exodeoxyribonuclease V subunit gamma [Candidatus Protochlamydia sp.]|nr:exodeoxyribonuclease V subunit gamma [Candidatus Protochlamydia sp.]